MDFDMKDRVRAALDGVNWGRVVAAIIALGVAATGVSCSATFLVRG